MKWDAGSSSVRAPSRQPVAQPALFERASRGAGRPHPEFRKMDSAVWASGAGLRSRIAASGGAVPSTPLPTRKGTRIAPDRTTDGEFQWSLLRPSRVRHLGVGRGPSRTRSPVVVEPVRWALHLFGETGPSEVYGQDAPYPKEEGTEKEASPGE